MVESDLQELDLLMERLCEGSLEKDREAVDRLVKLLDDSEACRRRYLDTLELHAALWRMGSLSATGSPGLPLPPSCPLAPVPASSYLSLSTPLGSFLFSYTAAAVILGMGIFLAWTCHVSDPQLNPRSIAVSPSPAPIRKPNAEERPKRVVVGVARVTDMVGVAWSDPPLAPSLQRVLLGDKFAVARGLVEITYDTGARVVLQGPCLYQVDSKAGGFLERGKLMARVEERAGGGRRGAGNPESQVPNQRIEKLAEQAPPLHGFSPAPRPQSPAPLFSVRTPTAVVNDLGTEFGVEVDDNGSCVHVFVGAVDFVPEGKPSAAIRTTAGQARRISVAARGAVEKVEKIALDCDRYARPRAMLEGKLREDQILFHDTFETFALGTRWQPSREGAPDDVLEAVLESGRHALRMKNRSLEESGRSPSKYKYNARAIKTVEAFSLQDTAALEVDVVFKPSKDAEPCFQVWLLGSSGKLVRMFLQPQLSHRIDYSVNINSNVSDSRSCLAIYHSPKAVYRNGERYRCRLSVNRQSARLVVQDDLNLAGVYQASFDDFTLADLGDNARVVLRLLSWQEHVSECWVYDVTVRGRPSAVHYPSLRGVREYRSVSTSVKPFVASH
jgi:hypothetical protein